LRVTPVLIGDITGDSRNNTATPTAVSGREGSNPWARLFLSFSLWADFSRFLSHSRS